MQAIFAVTVPFFALVLLGYLAAQREVLPEEAIPGLNVYVLFFALPCLLFRFGSSLPLARLIDPLLIAIYTVCALLMIAITIFMTWRRGGRDTGVDLKDAAFGALVAAFPNAGFMGVPLLVALLGDNAAGPVIGAILVDLILTSTLCLALAQASAHRAAGASERGVSRAAVLSLRGALTNPLPWAIVIGALFAAFDRELPAPLAQIVKMLGDSATPVALFTIGSVLWRAGRHAHTRTPVANYLPVALLKLVLHPALVFGFGTAATLLGAPVSRFGLMVLTLVAALPSASNVSVLAERYGADNGRVTRIIMASTVLAFATFSALAWAFGVTRTPGSAG
ncbi:MAG: AEC family transporter [Pseudomonadota bacterium]|nr:AEC family transporter [Pseudomonadota bacterium]